MMSCRSLYFCGRISAPRGDLVVLLADDDVRIEDAGRRVERIDGG